MSLSPLFYKLFFFFLIAGNPLFLKAQTQAEVGATMDKFYLDAGEQIALENFEKALSSCLKVQQLAWSMQDLDYFFPAKAVEISIHHGKKDWARMSAVIDSSIELGKKLTYYPDSIVATVNLNYFKGLYFFEMGQYEKCLQYYETVFAALKNEPYTIFETFDLVNNMAVALQNIGEYGPSIPYLNRAFALANHDDYKKAKGLNQLAYAHFKLEADDQARQLYLKGLDKIKTYRNNPEALDFEISMAHNIAELYLKSAQFDSAHYYLNHALQLRPDSFQLAKNFQTRGLIYLQENKTLKSEESFRQALKMRKKLYAAKSPQYGKTLHEIGKLLTINNRPKEGLAYFQQALCALSWDFEEDKNIALNPPKNTTGQYYALIETLLEKGKALALTDQKTLALATYQRALDIFETFRHSLLTSQTSNLYWQAKNKRLLELAIDLAIELGEKELAFQCAQQGHGLLLSERVHELKTQLSGALPDSVIQKEKALKIRITDLKLQLFEEKAALQQQKINAQIFENQYELAAFQKEIKNNYPEYFKQKYDLPTATTSAIQQQLNSDSEVLLEYFVGERQVFIFLVTKNDFQIYAQPKPADFAKWILDVRTVLNKNNQSLSAYQQYTFAANNLFQLLIAPLGNKLPQHGNLTIIPDEELGYIPFSVFLSQPIDLEDSDFSNYKTLPYLVQDYNFSYHYSSHLFTNLSQISKPQNAEKFLGFAPSFSGQSSFIRNGKSLDSLLFNKKEIATIKEIIGGRIYLDSTATRAAFLENLNQAQILHLSTHAEANDRYPLQSPIHLFDADITAGEIYNLQISAELAVLSACETGTGMLEKGEGIMSLARSFMHAGCPSVVTSLWKVNDQQTPTIMQYFYEKLFEAKRKDWALCEAQRQFLNDDSANSLAHPHYWASFIQIGNTQPVMSSKMPYWRYLFGVLGLFCLLFLGIKYRKSQR